MQKINKITKPFSRDIGDLLFQRTLGMQDHTHIKWHENTVASIDVELHATNKQNKSTLPKGIGTLLSFN